MAVDVKKMFNVDLPASMAKSAEEVRTIGGKFQLCIDGEGEWFIDASESGPVCRAGTGEADCTLSMAAEDFQTFMENPQTNAMTLFFAGKLKVEGNQMLALKLNKVFSL